MSQDTQQKTQHQHDPDCKRCQGTGLVDEIHAGVRMANGPAPCPDCEAAIFDLWDSGEAEEWDDALIDLVRRAHGK